MLTGESFGELLKDVLGRGLVFRFRAKGFSMSPFIKDGDVVTLSPLINCTPRLGDVVALISPNSGKSLIHRIIEKKKAGLVTKGDNSLCNDGLIPIKSIMGIVTCVERKKKKVLLGLGAEKYLIVILSRNRFLFSGFRTLRRIFQRRF